MDTNSNFVVGRSREALKRIHRHLDAFFDEKGMDFRVPVWWEVVRVPLIQFLQNQLGITISKSPPNLLTT